MFLKPFLDNPNLQTIQTMAKNEGSIINPFNLLSIQSLEEFKSFLSLDKVF